MKSSFLLSLAVSSLLLCFQPVQSQTLLPRDSEYVQVQNGHLALNGERVRFWAFIGKSSIGAKIEAADTPEIRAQKVAVSRRANEALVERVANLGFNANRLWNALPNTENYVVGDGSHADVTDFTLALMKKRGFKVWAAGFNRTSDAKPEDVAIVDDAASADNWAKAVASAPEGKMSLRNNVAKAWDARLEAIALRDMEAIAKHTNKHTGLRWCDDPVFAAWELSNEEWWMSRMVRGDWQKLPPFFRNSLIARWNDWLLKKYGDEAKLVAAWEKLVPGENLKNGAILFAPMARKTKANISLNDGNPLVQGALEGGETAYGREDFARKRGEDVLEFLLDLQMSHKKREAAAVKSWGKSTRLSPLLYDTGIGYEIQSQWLQQNAEAVAHDAYVNGWGPDFKEPELSPDWSDHQKNLKRLDVERISANSGPQDKGPWINWLLKPPGISQGVPWLEQNRVEGKPYFAYETQIQQPAKYRADFPLRIAALAAIQDWDWVCWHYFASGDDLATKENAFEKPMDVTTGDHPQGYHFTYDETQSAMMRAAGLMFRGALLKSAPNPTRFIFGRKSLLNPDSMTYAGSYGRAGLDMMGTTYQYGVRIQIDPTREDDQIIGPVVSFDNRNTHNPYTPTDQIKFDWKKGFLALDAPGAVAWTGLLAQNGNAVKFKNGVTLRDVSIQNPPEIFDPIRADEKYLAFALVSHDGLPLDTTRAASLSLVSTSFNSGFQMDLNGPRRPSGLPQKVTAGSLPVLTARVGATIESPALNGLKYTLRDWNWKNIGSGTITDGKLKISAAQPVFVVELAR